jgi:hypothetical protein
MAAGDRPDLPSVVTPALRDAIDTMTTVLDDAAADPAGVCSGRSDDWVTASQTARRAVVRMSLEMRLVATVER